jgi:ubiquinone/menaquinone biosynthesis C-methylase UbiE
MTALQAPAASKSETAEAAVRRALAPTTDEIRALPFTTNAATARDLLAGAGRRVVDIGCGDGKFTRALAGLFGEVTGIDVKERKLDEAREAAAAAGLTIDFRSGRGEAIPFADASLDVVVFSNSLHHMDDVDAALREAARVLTPGGLLYVMEPVPAGNYYEATRLVNDETDVRTEAYRALRRAMERDFVAVAETAYRARRQFRDFAEWHSDQLDRDPRRGARFDAHGEEVRARFEAQAEHIDGALAFDQVSRVNLLRRRA